MHGMADDRCLDGPIPMPIPPTLPISKIVGTYVDTYVVLTTVTVPFTYLRRAIYAGTFLL